MAFWYKRSYTLLMLLSLPFSWIFKGVVTLRRLLFHYKFFKTFRFSVPVIVVGNITVGGTGKTPLVIWLAHFLQTNGFRPGIVTRGFGGKKQKIPFAVTDETEPQAVGDEAVLLAQRSACPVVACVDRVAAVKHLLATTQCNVVIADDGLQHYRLGRDIEIAVVDAERQLGNRRFLPAGPLRESPKRLQEVDFVIQHGMPTKGLLSMQLVGNDIYAMGDQELCMPLRAFTHKIVHAVAGIGHPARFFAALREKGLQVIEHVFPDHYLYCAEDFQFSDTLPIVMTEKDAVKCKAFADQRFWYVPVEVHIEKVFQVALLAKLQE